MKIINFFKEVPGSIKGYLNSQELIRILFLTLAAGGGMEMMLSSLRASMNQLLVNPQNAAWVSAVIVALMEINRRLKQGDLPVVSEGSNDTKVSG
jgi:hypothetical protein